jgi:hypothetical protein
MSNIVLLVSADGNTETRVELAHQPLRINLPEGAVVETRDEMSGQWLPFVPHGHKHHRFTDFSLLD